MPLRVFATNCEVLRRTTVETKSGKTLLRVSAKSWNPTAKGQKPEEVFFNMIIFNPTEPQLSMGNGDRIDIHSAERPAIGRVDTNPNQVIVRKSDLGNAGADSKPARYFEIRAFGDDVTITEKANKTKGEQATEPSVEANPDLPISDHDDDLPF